MSKLPEVTSRKSVTLPDRLWTEISDYRFSQRCRTETEALRRLVELGLVTARREPAVGTPKRKASR